jgi:hypothetical protein
LQFQLSYPPSRLEIFRLETFRLETFRLETFRLETFRLETFRLETFRLRSCRIHHLDDLFFLLIPPATRQHYLPDKADSPIEAKSLGIE